ncbi:hypothetical protein BG006_003742, partial [Podila minutissima]
CDQDQGQGSSDSEDDGKEEVEQNVQAHIITVAKKVQVVQEAPIDEYGRKVIHVPLTAG